MTSRVAVSLLILAICLPTAGSYLWNSDINSMSEKCGQHNGSCADCISATQLNLSLLCYFCGNSCIAADYTSITSKQECYLNEFYVGQCSLNLLSIIVLATLACLCCCGTCFMVALLICCCCCCKTRRPKAISHPKQAYSRLINRDSLERQKMRDDRSRVIRERYAL